MYVKVGVNDTTQFVGQIPRFFKWFFIDYHTHVSRIAIVIFHFKVHKGGLIVEGNHFSGNKTLRTL